MQRNGCANQIHAKRLGKSFLFRLSTRVEKHLAVQERRSYDDVTSLRPPRSQRLGLKVLGPGLTGMLRGARHGPHIHPFHPAVFQYPGAFVDRSPGGDHVVEQHNVPGIQLAV